VLRELWRNIAGRSKRKIVYTALTAGYDRLLPPAIVDPDIDYLVYTDAPPEEIPPPWQARPIHIELRNPRVTSRWYKILPHRHLPRGGHSLWIDANYEIVGSLSALFDRLAATTKIGMARHPERNCAYIEADAVKGIGLEHPEIVDAQMAQYRRLGYPADHGLTESGVMFRAHGDPRVRAAMEDWWRQIENFSQRDQLSVNFVLWRNSLRYTPLPWASRESPVLRYHPHVKSETYLTAEDGQRRRDLLRAATLAAQ
jgi:hypothetical protein